MSRKGSILWSSAADVILITIFLILLVLFIYFGRDRIKDYIEVILDFLRM